MTTQHTPGPVLQSLKCGCHITGSGTMPDPMTVRQCPRCAAATDLLETLENLLVLATALSDETDWQIEEARAAIAKAKGEA